MVPAVTGNRPCVLIILDGWGLAPPGPGNALSLARTPNMDRLWATGPHSALAAAGLAVGLPQGQIGNSEVGHLNLGAGYRVLQELPRIDEAIASGQFFQNTALTQAVDHARDHGATLHLLGLFSHGGVHSHAHHLYALLDLAQQRGLSRVSVHPFLDGRDTAPRQAIYDLPELEARLQATGTGRIATISGRYYPMDRDKRWDRTARAYAALVQGEAPHVPTAQAAIEASYAAGVSDEFLAPVIVDPPPGATVEMPNATIQDGDVVLWFNFRADRARQLCHALLLPDFDGFPRASVPRHLYVVTFTEYETGLPVHTVAFPPQHVDWPVARVIADAGLTQYHIAETEKYAHVTYFFNGGREDPYPGETRLMIPSPKVATYDLQPEMSVAAVAAAAVERIRTHEDALIVMNFANGDMAGHTGILPAAIRAAEAVDAAVGQVANAALAAGRFVAITADHGNAEEMQDADSGQPKTAHSTNPVPFILAGVPPQTHLANTGVLADVAPVLLHLMGLPVPESMYGSSVLLPPRHKGKPR